MYFSPIGTVGGNHNLFTSMCSGTTSLYLFTYSSTSVAVSSSPSGIMSGSPPQVAETSRVSGSTVTFMTGICS